MDWYSWVSKSSLDPSLAAEYALLLSRNEIEESDIPHFDHEFLQSMGISIAKHRLEILKLARKPRRSPRARLLAAIHNTKNCLTRYIRSFVRRDSSAIVVVPRPPYGRWRGAVLKRTKRAVILKKGRLMLTDGMSNCGSHSASPMVYNFPRSDGGGDGGDGVWKIDSKVIRWDSMFQDLKPT